jgi:hypothetical protein
VFSFLLLIGGVVLSAIGSMLLVRGYSQRAELAPAEAQGIPATVLPFVGRARQEPPAATLRCPACGRLVKATEDTCPNCLRFLRAA